MTIDQEVKRLKQWVCEYISGPSWRSSGMSNIAAEFERDEKQPKGCGADWACSNCGTEHTFNEGCPPCVEPLPTPPDNEALAKELCRVFYNNPKEEPTPGSSYWPNLAAHVRKMIDEAVEKEALKGIAINDSWIKTTRRMIDSVEAKHAEESRRVSIDHALALQQAKREALMEACECLRSHHAYGHTLIESHLISALPKEGTDAK